MRGFSQRARDMQLGMAGRLKVIATPPLGYSVAPVALRRFLEDRPDVSVAFDVRRLEQVDLRKPYCSGAVSNWNFLLGCYHGRMPAE